MLSQNQFKCTAVPFQIDFIMYLLQITDLISFYRFTFSSYFVSQTTIQLYSTETTSSKNRGRHLLRCKLTFLLNTEKMVSKQGDNLIYYAKGEGRFVDSVKIFQDSFGKEPNLCLYSYNRIQTT